MVVRHTAREIFESYSREQQDQVVKRYLEIWYRDNRNPIGHAVNVTLYEIQFVDKKLYIHYGVSNLKGTKQWQHIHLMISLDEIIAKGGIETETFK